MTIEATRQASVQGTQTIEQSFSSQIVALESRLILAMQYDQTKTTVVENTLQQLLTPADTGNKYGYKSQLYLAHLRSYLQTGGRLNTFGVPLSEPATAAASAGEIDFTGTVIAANGNIDVYFNARKITIASVAADTPTTLGDKLVSAVAADNTIPYVLVNTAGVVACTLTWKGTTGDQGRIYVGPWKTGDNELPSGLVAAVTQPTAGVGDEATVLDDAWSAIIQATNWNTDVVTPVNTSGAMDKALDNIGLPGTKTVQGSGLWNDKDYRPCTNWVGSIETTYSTIAAIGEARKEDPDNVIVCSPDAMEFPFEIASTTAAFVGASANQNAATKYEGNLINLMGPLDESNDWTRDTAKNNVDLALKSGLTTIKANSSGDAILGDIATTYHPDGKVFPAFQYEVNKRKTWNIALTVKNDKIQFKNDVIVESVAEAPNQSMATDTDTEAGRIVKLAEGWESFGWCYNRTFTIQNLLVKQDAINPDRFNRAIPVLLSANKRVQSDQIQLDRNLEIANEAVTVTI